MTSWITYAIKKSRKVIKSNPKPTILEKNTMKLKYKKPIKSHDDLFSWDENLLEVTKGWKITPNVRPSQQSLISNIFINKHNQKFLRKFHDLHLKPSNYIWPYTTHWTKGWFSTPFTSKIAYWKFKTVVKHRKFFPHIITYHHVP